MPAMLQVPGTARLTLPYDFAAAQSYPLGTRLLTFDDRLYRYGRMGAVLGVTGSLYASEAPGANFDELVTAAAAVGATSITVTTGATAITADDFNGGYAVIEDDAGEGYSYLIEDTPAVSASTAGAVSLAHGVEVALTAATTTLLVKHPGDDVIIHPSPPLSAMYGVAAGPITATQYGWFQKEGLAGVLTEGTIVIAQQVRASETTDGAVAALDYDEAGRDEPILGVCVSVSATGEHSPIMLNIP